VCLQEYLWLGEVDSLGECQNAALEQAADPCVSTTPAGQPASQPAAAAELSVKLMMSRRRAVCLTPRVHSSCREEDTEACVSVAYYTSTSSELNFRKQCYCGTTKDWVADASPVRVCSLFDSCVARLLLAVCSRVASFSLTSCSLLAQAVISARFDGAVECWGWPLVLGLLGIMTSYLVIGAVYNMQTKQVTGLAGSAKTALRTHFL